MRGEIIYKILDSLEDAVVDAVDVFGAFLEAGYGANFSKMDYKYKIRSGGRHVYKVAREGKRNLQKYISKLKTQGLILENPQGQISLSLSGKKKLSFLKKKRKPETKLYKKETGDKFMIVSYDIPIVFNRERNILRDLLTLLGFKMVHKSFWMGKVLLPKEFFTELDRLGILKFVEIMEVTKTGTLKSVS